MCVLIFSTTFIWNISHSKTNSARYCHKFVSVILSNFNKTWKSVRWEPNCYGRTDMTKLMVAFRNFPNAPNKLVCIINSNYFPVPHLPILFLMEAHCVIFEVRLKIWIHNTAGFVFTFSAFNILYLCAYPVNGRTDMKKLIFFWICRKRLKTIFRSQHRSNLSACASDLAHNNETLFRRAQNFQLDSTRSSHWIVSSCAPPSPNIGSRVLAASVLYHVTQVVNNREKYTEV
jgi:hypothetical protein